MRTIRPHISIGLFCGGLLAVLPVNSVQAQPVPASPIGHSYEQKLSETRWWTMTVEPTKLIFTAMSGEKKGQVVLTVDNPTMKELTGGAYLVYWQEKDKSTAVHVYDFQKGRAYFNATKSDGSFINLEAL